MKTIIISDIHGKSKSVIPYGLNLAKTIKSDVDILHPIDSRIHQGEYSSFSDSKSISPGPKFSHKEIIQREKSWAQIELDKLLSSEASRLNYPLKVNTIAEENSIIDAIEQRLKKEPSAVFIINTEPDGYIFQSKSEIISTLENTGAMSLLVPPGQDLRMINKVLFPVDFHSENFSAYEKIHSFIRLFNPVINAVGFEKNGGSSSLEQTSKSWLDVAKSVFVPSAVEINLLKGEDFGNALNDYIENNQHDLLILFQQKQNKLKSIFKNNNTKLLLPKTELPALVYFQSS